MTLFRGRPLRTLALEAVAIVVLLATAGTLLYVETRPQAVRNLLPTAGTETDVSRNPRTQFAPALALSGQVLLGGSADAFTDTRIYVSTDGGARWRSTPGPPLLRANCELDRPAVAIGGGERELYAFTATQYCDLPEPKLHVAVRDGPGDAWHVTAVAPVRHYAEDTNLALAASGSRAYAAWTRKPNEFEPEIEALLAGSDDAGRTWSAAVRLPLGAAFGLAIAVGPHGDVDVTAADAATNAIVLLRSVDGGHTFTQRVVARLGQQCASLSVQPQTCVPPEPHVAVAPSGTVFVAWADLEANGTDAVRLASFTPQLRPLLPPTQIGPPDRAPSDQFDPSLAVDASTGDVWACYENTLGDPYRHRAWPTCTRSRDGGRTWATPVHVTRVASDETNTAADQHGYGSTAVVAADGIAHVMWTDSRSLEQLSEEIYAARLTASAMTSPQAAP